MTNNWAQEQTQLLFAFGEIHLFSATFPSLVLEAHFSELSDNPDVPPPPLDELVAGMEAAVTPAHPVGRKLPRFALLPQAIRYVPSQYSRHYIELQSSFAAYLAGFSPKARSTLLRKIGRFSEFSGGSVSWREYRGAAELSDFYQLALEVAKRSWQARRLPAWGVRDDSEFRKELVDLAARDSARGYILFHRGRPISYLYCPIRDDIVFYRYVGYDPEYQHWSPGIVLQYFVLENLFKEARFRLFDFCEGAGQHKELFSTGSIPCADIRYFRRTIRNGLLVTLHSGLSILSRTVVEAFRIFGLKARVKRVFRRKL